MVWTVSNFSFSTALPGVKIPETWIPLRLLAESLTYVSVLARAGSLGTNQGKVCVAMFFVFHCLLVCFRGESKRRLSMAKLKCLLKKECGEVLLGSGRARIEVCGSTLGE